MFDTSEYVLQALLDEGALTSQDAARAAEAARDENRPVEETLIRMGLIEARKLSLTKAMICEYPYIDLDRYEPELTNCQLISRSFAEQHDVFPLFVFENSATVAMLDPLNLPAIDGLSQSLRREIDPVIVESDQLRSLIRKAYSLTGVTNNRGVTALPKSEAADTLDDEPIVAAVNQIMEAAIDAGASDVHLCPDENDLYLRFRIDGVLETQQGPDRSSHNAIVQRLKVMADLDITQTRRPQDGKFRVHRRGDPVDIRLSVLPTIHGENAVIRILRSGMDIGSVEDLGMPAEVQGEFINAIAQPHGMVLVTGPTGSGKTTTLYTALARLNTPDRNVMTIEDPVEIRLPWVRQIQVNNAAGLTFATALRSILRQDPDVVLVGEIRDEETARIAVQASLTGHMVFATLHTNDSVGSLARLSDFNIEPFAVNSALLGTLAQRLVRRVCPACAESERPTPIALREFGIKPAESDRFQRGTGCSECRSVGYAGRIGVYEFMSLTPTVQELVENGTSIRLVRERVRALGMPTLLDHGIQLARSGRTTIDELAKIATLDQLQSGLGSEENSP